MPAKTASTRRRTAPRSSRSNRRPGALWTTVNERDELGSDLVPDYLTSVKDGGFYGWPYSYYGQHVDRRVPANPEMVARAIVPDYAQSHGIAWARILRVEPAAAAIQRWRVH